METNITISVVNLQNFEDRIIQMPYFDNNTLLSIIQLLLSQNYPYIKLYEIAITTTQNYTLNFEDVRKNILEIISLYSTNLILTSREKVNGPNLLEKEISEESVDDLKNIPKSILPEPEVTPDGLLSVTDADRRIKAKIKGGFLDESKMNIDDTLKPSYKEKEKEEEKIIKDQFYSEPPSPPGAGAPPSPSPSLKPLTELKKNEVERIIEPKEDYSGSINDKGDIGALDSDEDDGIGALDLKIEIDLEEDIISDIKGEQEVAEEEETAEVVSEKDVLPTTMQEINQKEEDFGKDRSQTPLPLALPSTMKKKEVEEKSPSPPPPSPIPLDSFTPDKTKSSGKFLARKSSTQEKINEVSTTKGKRDEEESIEPQKKSKQRKKKALGKRSGKKSIPLPRATKTFEIESEDREEIHPSEVKDVRMDEDVDDKYGEELFTLPEETEELSIISEEIKVPQIKTYRKNISIDYFNVMNPEKYYPMIVNIANIKQKKKIDQENIFTGERKTQKQDEMEVQLKSSSITVRPIFPGCSVTPLEIQTDFDSKEDEVTFYITPMVNDDLEECRVDFISSEDIIVHSVATPSKVQDPRYAKTIALYGTLASMIPKIFLFFEIDIGANNTVDRIAPWMETIFGSMTLSNFIGLFGIGIALIVSVAVFFKRKPKKILKKFQLKDLRKK